MTALTTHDSVDPSPASRPAPIPSRAGEFLRLLGHDPLGVTCSPAEAALLRTALDRYGDSWITQVCSDRADMVLSAWVFPDESYVLRDATNFYATDSHGVDSRGITWTKATDVEIDAIDGPRLEVPKVLIT
jgi:hypothetical protein